MAEVTVTNTALKILEDLINDRWRSAAHRTDDFTADEGHVSFIEVLVRALATYGGYPELFSPEPVEPDGLLRDGSGLALHLATNDVSTLSLPGFVQEITDRGEISFLIPTFSRGSRAIDITDINLRPAEGVGSLTLDWEDAPPSLVMRVAFETEGWEIVGFREIDWEQMEVLIRFQPRIEAGRLLWSHSVEVDFSPTPSGLIARRIAEGVESAIRSLLTTQLDGWVAEIGAYLLSLPLRPPQDRNGEITLSTLGPLEFLELISQRGADLPDRWGNFTENFVNCCLLPNNPLRAIELDGLEHLFWPARLVDHFVQHNDQPIYEPEHNGIEGALTFDVDPIQVPGELELPYHDPGYESFIIQREKYQVILDHVQLPRQVFDNIDRIMPGRIRWTVTWTIDVRHPNLDWPSWVRLRSKEVRITSRSPVLDLDGRGLSIDWLETGGEVRISGEVRALGRVIASFSMDHPISRDVPIGSCMGLEQVASTVTARARLVRLTTIDRRQLTWLRVVMRHLYLQVDREFLYQYLGHPPPMTGDEWLTEQILARLHVAVYINDDLLSLTSATSFRITPRAGLITGYGYTFPEAHSTFYIHHRAMDADARFTLKVALCVLETDNTLTEAATVEQEIRRNDPLYRDTRWRIPFGESSTRLLLGEEGGPMRVSVGLQNELFRADDLPVEYRPKPYDITVTNVHVYRDFSIGRGEMDFWYRIWSETAGQPSDRQLEGKLGYVQDRAEFDWTPVAYAFRWEAPVGSTVHVMLWGKEYGVRVHSMGDQEVTFDIPAGDLEDHEHASSSDLFDFQVQVQTASPPPTPIFEVEGADAERRLEILPTESWSFHYAISWADSVELVYSSDPDLPCEDWGLLQTLYHETAEGAEGELIGDRTVEPPEGLGQRGGFYRLRVRNSAGETCSVILELVLQA